MRSFTSPGKSTMIRGGAKGKIQNVPADFSLCLGPSLSLCQLLAAGQVAVAVHACAPLGSSGPPVLDGFQNLLLGREQDERCQPSDRVSGTA